MPEKIIEAVLTFDEDHIEMLVKEALEKGYTSQEIIDDGLGKGMSRALEKYNDGEYDVPEVIVCADVLNKGLSVLSERDGETRLKKAKIILAIVEGDTHEIGKNIVKIMLEASGYDVIDLGVNCETSAIIREALANNADFIGLGSMMTTTRGSMKKLIDELNGIDAKGQKKPLVIVGGGSVTPDFALEIGAHAFGGKAPDTIKILEEAVKNETAKRGRS